MLAIDDLIRPPVSARAIEHDDEQIEPGDWFACDWPERPYEPEHTVFLSDCYPCRLALRAAALSVVRRPGPTSDADRSVVVLSAAWGTT